MKNKKLNKILFTLIAVAVGLFLVLLAALQIYLKADARKTGEAPGNALQYSLENVQPVTNSPLRGKRFLFLGSSVTDGSAAQGCSFADYLGKTDGVIVTKEAASSTTLVDEFSIVPFLAGGDGNSYVTRLKKVDTNTVFDAVVVQLSTNDATSGKSLGEICATSDPEDFDTKTITGAIEFIIWYAQETWNCPVIFYTGSYFESQPYDVMVDRLLELQSKWDIGIIDLYNDEAFNGIDAQLYALYMYDEKHPTKAGYLEWWIPAIQAYLYDYLG